MELFGNVDVEGLAVLDADDNSIGLTLVTVPVTFGIFEDILPKNYTNRRH